jgi:hypothetical protein
LSDACSNRRVTLKLQSIFDNLDRNQPLPLAWEAALSVLITGAARNLAPSFSARAAFGPSRAAIALSLSLLAGCGHGAKAAPVATPASHGQAEERPPFRFQPPVELEIESEQTPVVRLVGEVTCSGTLIAEDLVLTAHHCVSARDEGGKVVSKDRPPESITVELGGGDLPWGEVKVRAIVSPDCGYASGHGDIAILVLDRKLVGVPTLNPRLDAAPSKNEGLFLIGFGRCALGRDPIHRVTRTSGAVARVRSGDFVSIASVCPGDSGGPAYSPDTGDVIGVISASVMDGDETTSAPSVFTRLDIWPELFSAARGIADGMSPSELPPFRGCSQ